MKKTFETVMIVSGEAMGIETIEETAHCLIALSGVITSLAFAVYGLAFFP